MLCVAVSVALDTKFVLCHSPLSALIGTSQNLCSTRSEPELVLLTSGVLLFGFRWRDEHHKPSFAWGLQCRPRPPADTLLSLLFRCGLFWQQA